MPTLGVNVAISMASDKTRSQLDSFYRGIKVEGVTIRPYSTLEAGDTKEYSVSQSNFFIFVSDSFNGVNPFDLTLISSELDEYNNKKEIKLMAVGVMILDVANIETVIVTNTTESSLSYRLLS